MKRIHIVYDGGTIGMVPGPEGLMPPENADEFTQQVMIAIQTDEELAGEIDAQFHLVSTEDSVNKRPNSWTQLAYKVQSLQDDGDGIVVLHGTDTMQWSAAALQFAFRSGMRIPVMLTGAQIRMKERWGDAITNVLRTIRTVLKAAELQIADVGVVFDDLILSGVRCGKRTDDKFGAFDAQAESFRGGIVTTAGPVFFPKVFRRKKAGELTLQPHFSGGVFTIELGPLTDPEMIDVAIKAGTVRAVLLKSPGEGNVPDRFLPFIKRWVHEHLVPVVIASKFVAGRTGGAHYKSGSAPLVIGAVAAFDTQDSTAEVKMSWLLAQGVVTSEAFRRAMATNFVGEVNSPRKKAARKGQQQ